MSKDKKGGNAQKRRILSVLASLSDEDRAELVRMISTQGRKITVNIQPARDKLTKIIEARAIELSKEIKS